jgi:predicted amidohydrolase YtcJ
MPQLRDAHLHLLEHGEELSHLNLSACASLDDALQRIAHEAAHAPAPGAWLTTVGVRTAAWPERRYPTARELHDAAAGRPVLLRSFDHHAMCVSTRALALANITRDTPDPPGGLIERDPSTREPTGLLLESACRLITAALPKPTPEDRRTHLRAALTDLAQQGFVEVHDMLSTPGFARLLLELEARAELPMRVLLYPTREHFGELAAMQHDADLSRSRFVRLAGLKLFTDGTLNSRTAHMLHDFREPIPNHPRGTALMSTSDIISAINHAATAGYPIAAHAIGDGAVRSVLDAIEATPRRSAGSKSGSNSGGNSGGSSGGSSEGSAGGSAGGGHRIEHAQFVDESDIPRFARLNVIASVQPCHLLTDIEAIERFAPHRAERAFPLRDLFDSARAAGRDPRELLWLGSDTPVVPPAPDDNFQAAVHRRRAGTPPERAIAPRQALTRDETLACYTPRN